MVWKGRETHLVVKESHQEVEKGSVDPPGGTRRVGRPTRRSGKGRETQPEVRAKSGVPPEGPGRV